MEEEPKQEKPLLECRVLLVEDFPDSQRLISYHLKQAGAEVFFADNGLIALELALEARDHGLPFDIILMDIQIPVFDGNEATKILREADLRIPIIALTAHDDLYNRDQSMQAGCDEYFTKPVDAEVLVDTLAEYMKTQEKLWDRVTNA
ncbi:Polar-differentiation response regulator DivK [Gimesia alba]|uniref:Polar-differentiation response regulator DivK n=1 Tax=Gimesia alba TaxID=2527973 RepID=A0A517RFM7_9PLAN|nr:response regulator [Gimesia alba]QDT42679.1 Polar-differentiation response regulator DivK [Gimesia alba]